ncbi:MAG: FAD-binding protein [Rikenellaceae bacterium]|nr:FAD-binding protein [Rikenellaceae bacterium]
MPFEVTITVSPREASDPKLYLPIAASRARISKDNIAFSRIIKRSVDARSRQVKVNLTVQIFADGEGDPDPVHFEYGDVSHRRPVIIVGAGPAGLFAALKLIELGIKPIIIERGKDVSSRKYDIAKINRNGDVDPDSNYAFGEGGAGAFSDGKLFTRSKKRGNYRKALEVLRFHGAEESVLYDAHPHIGTDRLPRIIADIRRTILQSGGEILFNTRLTDIIIRSGKIAGVVCSGADRIDTNAVILATGHSARDIYKLLNRKNILLEPKAFAMGVRIEHPQTLIDSIQYHMPERGEYLPAASYTLKSQVNGRGVYSFCMCPGGFIVPAMTSGDEAVVNGMSPSGRNSVFANSGLVTEVRTEDFAHLVPAHGVLAGLVFQEQFERTAFDNGGGMRIVPAQRVADFVNGKRSSSLCKTSYHPGGESSNMKEWMPPFIYNTLRLGIQNFGKKMRGFMTNEAMLLGVESRTSSPVRIPRDTETLMHPQIYGLYPCAEGAGYAGGIVSAAIDGERCAEMAALQLGKNKST